MNMRLVFFAQFPTIRRSRFFIWIGASLVWVLALTGTLSAADASTSHPRSPRLVRLDERIAQAKEFYKQENYQKAFPLLQEAAELEPDNTDTLSWLAYTAFELHRYAEAIAALEKVLVLDPDDAYARKWLAYVLAKSGDTPNANRHFEILASRQSGDEQIETMEYAGKVMDHAGDTALAAVWWKRATEKGSHFAARQLSEAYLSGEGVPEDIATSFYYLRLCYHAFAGFPHLPHGEYLIKLTHGWILVLAAILSSTLVPMAISASLSYMLSRPLARNPEIHWTERARLGFPLQYFMKFSIVFSILIYSLGTSFYPAFLLPISNFLLFWITLPCILLAMLWVSTLFGRYFRQKPDTTAQKFQGFLVAILLYFPVISIFILMVSCLPSRWNAQALLVILLAVLLIIWMHMGGLTHVGRWLRLIYPAGPEITRRVEAVATRMGCRMPSVWMLRWQRTNAFALPFANAIWITETLPSHLTPEELDCVVGHELGHLCEGSGMRFTRLIASFLLLPFFTFRLWPPDHMGLCFCLSLLFLFAGQVFLKKFMRRMEERADSYGKVSEEQPGIYAQALEKLYRFNLMPVVMRKNKMIHPDLYDRMIAAGITPDYPRPAPPPRWAGWAALCSVLLNLAGILTIWLFLF